MARTKYNIIAGALNRVFVLLLGFLIRTFVIRYLGAEYIGLSGVVTSILNVLNLAELGFTSAVTFNLYKPVAEKNKELVCALLSFYRKAFLYIGFFVLITGIGILPFLNLFIRADIPPNINIRLVYVVYLINTCAGYFLFGYINVLLIAHQRNDIDSYLSILTYIIEYGIQIIVLIFYKSYYLYIIAIPVATVIMNFIRYGLARKLFPDYKCYGKLDEATKKSVFENIKGLIIQKICASTRNTFDSIFISSYIGLLAAGLYSNYFYIISSVHGILVVFNSAMSAGIGNSIATETQEKNHADMMKFIFIYGWLSGISTICILCLYQPFMRIWAGKSNLLPFFDVLLFCAYYYSLTLGDIRSNYSAGAGLWWHERYRSLVEVIANIILNAVLGKLFGIPGIILATLITIVIINFGYGSTIVYRRYFTSFSVLTFYKKHGIYFLVALLTAVPTYMMTQVINRNGIIGLIEIGIIATIMPNIVFFCVYSRTQVFKDSVKLLKRTIGSRR